MTYRIAENGESAFHIVAHQYADECVRHAAAELQKYLLRATGAAIPYFSDRCPRRGPELRVGPCVRGNADPALPEEGFSIRADGEDIVISGGSSRGVLYGVYGFLERFCGFQCFTKDAEVLAQTDLLEIDLTEITAAPAFDFRESYSRDAFDGDFCAKNHFNSSLADLSRARGGRVKWFNFHHSFCDLVPEAQYFDEHPEYYSEIDGKRVPDSQLCLTNPEVARIAERTLRGWIADNPEARVFSVAQNDNTRRCTCKNCLRVEQEEGSAAGPVIRFVNGLADAIRDDHPDVLLHTFAYKHTVAAPKTAARENVIVRLCSFYCRFDEPFETQAREEPDGDAAVFVNALRDWKARAKQLYVWDYTVNYWNYLVPFFNFHALAENVRFFRDTGVRGLLEEGNFAYGGGACFDDLKSYLIAKLLWDPDADVDTAIRRFTDGVYGKASGAILRDYLSMMERACCSKPLGIHQFSDAPWITDGLVDEGERLFAAALDAAENETCRKRIEREQLSIRFLRLTRLPLDAPGRAEAIEAFFRDLKRFGITEIRERRSLAVIKKEMLESRYLRDRTQEYKLYYIMQ